MNAVDDQVVSKEDFDIFEYGVNFAVSVNLSNQILKKKIMSIVPRKVEKMSRHNLTQLRSVQLKHQ